MKDNLNLVYLRDENQKALKDLLQARDCNLCFEVILIIEGRPTYFLCEDCKYMSYKKFNEMFKALQEIKVMNSRARRYVENRLQPRDPRKKYSTLDFEL